MAWKLARLMSHGDTSPPSIDPDAIRAAVQAAIPGARFVELEALDRPLAERIAYGEPLLIRVETEDAQLRELLLHTATDAADIHPYRADRAKALLLAFDTIAATPRHARALDVGAVHKDGSLLVSLRDVGEFYMLSEFVPGLVYADELRAVAERGQLVENDIERVNDLALYLAELHVRYDVPSLYRQSVRDVFGGAEGVFGIVDGYPEETPGCPRMILERLERLLLPWRWKLRAYEHRTCRVHGDFNPFNAVFASDGLRLLEARRGGFGEPADDAICMPINYVFFGLLWPGTWKPCFRRLWNAYWNTYLSETGDAQMLQVVAPFLAARALSLCNPTAYATTSAYARERLLTVVEQVLTAPRFDPAVVETLFREEEPRSRR